VVRPSAPSASQGAGGKARVFSWPIGTSAGSRLDLVAKLTERGDVRCERQVRHGGRRLRESSSGGDAEAADDDVIDGGTAKSCISLVNAATSAWSASANAAA
jgi:hypothetical protein